MNKTNKKARGITKTNSQITNRKGWDWNYKDENNKYIYDEHLQPQWKRKIKRLKYECEKQEIGDQNPYTSRGITKHEDEKHTKNLKHGTMWEKKVEIVK